MQPSFRATPTNDLLIEFDDGKDRRKITLKCRKIEHALGGTTRLAAIADMLNTACKTVEEKP